MTEDERKAKQREYTRRWKEAHPNYQTEYMRKYRQEHREQWNARCREYQARHREAQRKRMNDQPHDDTNTVCACRKCNTKRYVKNFGEYLATLGFTSMDQWVEFIGGKYCDSITITRPDDE